MSHVFTGLESFFVQASTPSVPSIRRSDKKKRTPKASFVSISLLRYFRIQFARCVRLMWKGSTGGFYSGKILDHLYLKRYATMTKQWRRWDYIFIAGKSSQHAAERDQIHSSLCGDLSIFIINPKNKPEKWYLRGLSSHFSFCLFVFFCLFFSSYFPLSYAFKSLLHFKCVGFC